MQYTVNALGRICSDSPQDYSAWGRPLSRPAPGPRSHHPSIEQAGWEGSNTGYGYRGSGDEVEALGKVSAQDHEVRGFFSHPPTRAGVTQQGGTQPGLALSSLMVDRLWMRR